MIPRHESTETNITLELPMEAVRRIKAGLLELPGKIGNPVIFDIERQIMAQMKPEPQIVEPQTEAA